MASNIIRLIIKFLSIFLLTLLTLTLPWFYINFQIVPTFQNIKTTLIFSGIILSILILVLTFSNFLSQGVNRDTYYVKLIIFLCLSYVLWGLYMFAYNKTVNHIQQKLVNEKTNCQVVKLDGIATIPKTFIKDGSKDQDVDIEFKILNLDQSENKLSASAIISSKTISSLSKINFNINKNDDTEIKLNNIRLNILYKNTSNNTEPNNIKCHNDFSEIQNYFGEIDVNKIISKNFIIDNANYNALMSNRDVLLCLVIFVVYCAVLQLMIIFIIRPSYPKLQELKELLEKFRDKKSPPNTPSNPQ